MGRSTTHYHRYPGKKADREFLHAHLGKNKTTARRVSSGNAGEREKESRVICAKNLARSRIVESSAALRSRQRAGGRIRGERIRVAKQLSGVFHYLFNFIVGSRYRNIDLISSYELQEVSRRRRGGGEVGDAKGEATARDKKVRRESEVANEDGYLHDITYASSG